MELADTLVLETRAEIALGVQILLLRQNYLGEKIRDHLGDGSNYGTNLKYLEERDKLGTAGALSLLSQDQSAPLLVLNGDIITDFDSHNSCLP